MITTVNKSIHRIQQSLQDIVMMTEKLSEETIRWKPSEEEWSILQILSHLVEAVPYWLGEVERVVTEPGTSWGRGLQDAARLGAVTDPEKLLVKDVLVEVVLLIEKVESGLQGLDSETLQQESPHRNFAKFGNKPVSFIIDHFIEEHLAGHAKQILRNLEKLRKKEEENLL
ncbi:DinB family protein [Niallia sp. Krafla_26]|uniref:DinB family protein n=1 Tax=Niallia sp. Krafla_26 TaxID=3064703 RepID=UPI003D175247